MKRFLEAGCAFRRGTGAGRSGPKLKTQLGSTRDSLPNRAVALNQRPDQPRRRPDGGGEPPRAPDPELASNQRRQPPARHHARHRPDHRQRDRGERAGRESLPLRPQISAWLGLTLRAHSSGGKDRRTGISKQGDGYTDACLCRCHRGTPLHAAGRSGQGVAAAAEGARMPKGD